MNVFHLHFPWQSKNIYLDYIYIYKCQLIPLRASSLLDLQCLRFSVMEKRGIALLISATVESPLQYLLSKTYHHGHGEEILTLLAVTTSIYVCPQNAPPLQHQSAPGAGP